MYQLSGFQCDTWYSLSGFRGIFLHLLDLTQLWLLSNGAQPPCGLTLMADLEIFLFLGVVLHLEKSCFSIIFFQRGLMPEIVKLASSVLDPLLSRGYRK